MSATSAKNFNLPWHQHDQYWISICPASGSFSAKASAALQKAGVQKNAGGGMSVQAPRAWKPVWDKLYAALEQAGALAEVEAAVMPGAAAFPQLGAAEYKPVAFVQRVADSLWLGDALLEDRVVCYLQPVVSAKDKIFGYESFARVKGEGGKIIGGGEIVAASKMLGIEYMIDRHLHVQAINTFASSEFNGFLFVNFFPGFIHRPAVYLEGLSETAKSFGIVAKHIVLDFTNSELPRDSAHLKSVCDYGRLRGDSIALDDISSVESARRLIAEIRPDFLKIDMQLVHKAQEPGARETIRAIVGLIHGSGGTVIAEGVETDDVYRALKSLGVDLFQGYLFSPPVPVETALKRGTGTV